jgi:hypothetical protein
MASGVHMMVIIRDVGAERKRTRPEAMDPMQSCCEATLADRMDPRLCAACGHAGKSVGLITLKALLRPAALERLPGKGPFARLPRPALIMRTRRAHGPPQDGSATHMSE